MIHINEDGLFHSYEDITSCLKTIASEWNQNKKHKCAECDLDE